MESLSLLMLVGAAIASATLLYSLLNFQRQRPPLAALPPGPKGWPVLGHIPIIGTRPNKAIADLVLKYGPLMSLRFGTLNAVIVSSGDAVAAFLKAHDINLSSRPVTSLAKYLGDNCQDMIHAPYGAYWLDMRKMCTAKLSARALDESLPAREEEMAELVQVLVTQGDGGRIAVKLLDTLNMFSTNILSRMMMGRRLFCKESAREGLELMKILEEIQETINIFCVGDFLPWLSWLDVMHKAKMKSLRERYDQFMDRIIASQNDNQDSCIPKTDMLSMMLGMVGQPFGADDSVLSLNAIKSLILDLFVGGTESTAVLVDFGMAELMKQPQILKAAQKEIDSVVGRERIVLETDPKSLPLVQAIVKEVLRLHPAGPLSAARMTSESCQVDGYCIPKGTALFLNLTSVLTDPAVWPRPLEFWPQRFLHGGSNSGEKFMGGGFRYIPFGAGRRICPGLNLALRTMPLFIATLVHAFDWELPRGEEPTTLNMEKVGVITSRRAQPLIIHPVPRLDATAYHFQNKASQM